jgi:hypothetical protein
MNSPIGEHFKRLDVFESPHKIFSFDKNPQNNLFVIVRFTISLYTNDFKLLCKIEDFTLRNWGKVLTTFSPEGDYLIICEESKPGFLIIFEIATQRKFYMEEKLSFSQVYFIPYTTFIIIKTDTCITTIPFSSKKQKKEMKIEKIIPTKKPRSMIVNFARGVIYLFDNERNVHLYDINTKKLIEIKEISGLCTTFFIPKISFLMKNGNIFLCDGFYQHILDKDCNILQYIEAYNFKYLKILQVVETENFIVSISGNFLTIQDPLTLIPLAHYQRKEDFSSLLYLSSKENEPCLLTGFSTNSNFLAWFLIGSPKMIHMMGKSQLFDIQFHFKERIELLENQVSGGSNISIKRNNLKPKRHMNILIFVPLCILIIAILIYILK